MQRIIDCDQHLYESRTTWLDHIDPTMRDEALRIEDDDLGYAHITWRGRRLGIADVQIPRDTEHNGRHRERYRQGLPPEYRYDEALPDHYWDPPARARHLAELGGDEAVLFANVGLLWERRLSGSLPALTANMAAWNRWCATVRADGDGRLHPVAHLTLRDADWLDRQLRDLSNADVRLAMIAPALVDGRPLSHPDHDPIWAAFVDCGITPIFHVADQPRVFDDAWYAEEENSLPVLESVFLWTPAALGVTDLITNGPLDRFPDLRIGIIELSAIWVPMFLLMLDGGWDFVSRLNGRAQTELSLRPSEYFRRHVRVAAFSYEEPRRLEAKAGDLFMCCSDYPHSEGTSSPVADYEARGNMPESSPGLFHDNTAFLLRDAA